MTNFFKNSPTFRLFKKEPSFLEGASHLLDIKARAWQYNHSATEDEADRDALRSDWQAVGNDFRSSIKAYEQGLTKQPA